MAIHPRRRFIQGVACSALLHQTGRLLPALSSDTSRTHMEHKPTSLSSVIDSHIHLYDPTRPGGIPWPEKDDPVLYQPALPARYSSIAEPFGVLGGHRDRV